MNYCCSTLLIAAVLSITPAYGAPELDAYGKLQQVSNVSISPNGDLISYRRTESDEKDYIVVYSLKEGKMKTGVDVSSIDPSSQFFGNNNHLIFKVSQRVNWRAYKHSFDVSTAYSFNIKKNKIEPLLKLDESLLGDRKVTRGQTGLGRISGISNDGNNLFMPAYVADSDTDQTPNYAMLKVQISGKGKPKIVSKGTTNTRDYFLNDKGEILARETLNNVNNIHAIELKDGKKWRKIYSYEAEIPTHSFIGLSSDFSSIVFSRSDDDEHYLMLSLSDGKVQPLSGFDASKNTFGVMSDHRSVVVGVRYAGLMPSYHMFDSALNKRVQEIVSTFPDHSVYLSDWTKDWKSIVVRVEGTQFVGDYYLFHEGQPPKFLVSSRLDISPEDINPIATAKYKARDGLVIPTLVTLPKTKMDNLKNLPTVILPHGGPASQDHLGFNYEAQALASRGFLVVQPQFRGSTGFGKEHYEAGWGQWGKAMQDDLTDAVNFLVKKGYTDPARVCIVGGSYGGYAALAGAAFTPDLYKCSVSIAGVSHLPKMLEADKSRAGKHSWVLDYWNRSILAGDFDKDSLKAISPYYSADKIKVPVLLIHGEDDTVVEYEQSKLMHKAIKKSGGKSQLVKLKDDDHHLRDGSTRTQALKAMVEFVEANIGG
ncbi:Dipeptidyl aminopeptidase/acylaminoacyl peptidase [Alteromonadaceae bacterium Bs31]|nr:Dipeptidyl aminopeptidase/acylaminoacyl peptidase [Alteromonadaceae bacterium Bs31]